MYAIYMCVPAWGGVSEKWFVNCQCWKNSHDALVYFCYILFCPANLSSFHPSPRGECWRQSEISLKEASSVLYSNKNFLKTEKKKPWNIKKETRSVEREEITR